MIFKRKNKKFNLQEVLEDCRRNKPLAQKLLLEQYANRAKNICLRYSANEFEAEEMLSDAFVKIFAKIHLYDEKQVFESWFRRVVINTAIDYYRKNQEKVSWVSIENADFVPEFNDSTLYKISAEQIMNFVQKLAPTYRTTFSLYVVEGYKHDEIAEMMGITESASRSNLSKARAILQQWIENYTNSPINISKNA